MHERIYTIPVNLAFEKQCGCPFCTLENELEHNEIDSVMGAAMMEPDIRIQTNKLGFCHRHFGMMLGMKNRLGLGLILESHLDKLNREALCKGGMFAKQSATSSVDYTQKLKETCYVCEKIEEKFIKMIETACLLWEEETSFRELLKNQPYICMRHYPMFLKCALSTISKKKFADFAADLRELEEKYMKELKEDVSWFCKKFDYRYDAEPWGNSKDSVDRAIKFLSGDINTEFK
jgi:hypothetical protein